MSESLTTEDLLKRWVRAQQGVNHARRELSSAEVELSNATATLGKHLTPKDAAPGEQFSIWVNGKCVGLSGDCMLTVTDKGNQSFSIEWREKNRAARKI